jgi:hypothetical protein
VLRPVKTVLATTKEELDAALATADQITVECDDELLSYAVNKAARDPENRVAVEVTGPANPIDALPQRPFTLTEILADHSDQDLDETLAEATMVHTPRPAAPVRATVGSGGFDSLSAIPLLRVGKWLLWILGGGLFLVIGAAAWFWFGTNTVLPSPPAEPSAPAPSQPSQPPTPSSDFWANLPSLVWPLVAIVAIIALFLIARQAISSGHNVEFTLTVTEKVKGRVVLTKVPKRAPRRPKAA